LRLEVVLVEVVVVGLEVEEEEDEEDEEEDEVFLESTDASLLNVFLPTIPSTASLYACWNRLTAASVFVPKIPSTLPQS
jgi:hypothetical protein